MGRGRAKAKQTKVARDLKYSSPQTDFQRLQQELGGSGSPEPDGLNGDGALDDRWVDDDDWRR
ncbi:hypothetical protein MMAD_46960 [Mycolicibacterium madagascariense]|uniref:DUF3073 domain-containing protein n=1 Tax=Mycolicibacterium madagascariense TaxID=212765 RepID=A0A7I7XME3_9MYCO|nr:DUF3073 domain-containing protein [Mycolicibacterium madagascariense]MCV7013094.1 DUF3073 domain-containing protein [Mycolicibacterium madagascariense]BBZ30401.1 hypothetical protein MMAD_46960 [Mycolicibacterium madagascariense]